MLKNESIVSVLLPFGFKKTVHMFDGHIETKLFFQNKIACLIFDGKMLQVFGRNVPSDKMELFEILVNDIYNQKFQMIKLDGDMKLESFMDTYSERYRISIHGKTLLKSRDGLIDVFNFDHLYIEKACLYADAINKGESLN